MRPQLFMCGPTAGKGGGVATSEWREDEAPDLRGRAYASEWVGERGRGEGGREGGREGGKEGGMREREGGMRERERGS